MNKATKKPRLDMMNREPMLCPFCGYKADGDYQIMLHMETNHPEDNTISPFTVQGDDPASMAAVPALTSDIPPSEQDLDDDYFLCPLAGCGEAILLTEFESHIEMHGEEDFVFDEDCSTSNSDREGKPGGKQFVPAPDETEQPGFDAKLSHMLRNLDDLDDGKRDGKQASAKAAWKGLLKMPKTSIGTPAPVQTAKGKRLGKAELGPHANEKQMPSWLFRLLEQDGRVKTENKIDHHGNVVKVKVCPNMAAGVVPVLAQLLEQDADTQYAYMCDPAVRHVSKIRREGGFCGYRNIQMLCSYIVEAESQGHEFLDGKIPTIFQIQQYIETAWDLGINSQGRIETGGIRGTRKYIGTPDAQAMFCSLGIACSAQGLRPRKDSTDMAHELLFKAVEQYFTDGCTDYTPKVRRTSLPPIYFQHPGHSMTIVGFEKQRDGARNLIVFDPMFHDAEKVLKLVGESFRHKHPDDLLRAYRRGVKYLKKYAEFEILKLTPPKKAVEAI